MSFEQKSALIGKLAKMVEGLSRQDAILFIAACASIESLEQIVQVAEKVEGKEHG